MRFDLTKYRGVSIKSFDMDEMIGRDSLDALARAVGPRDDNAPPVSGYQMQVSHRNQLIAQAISKVNDEVVMRPYLAWTDWTLRTQEFVLAAHGRLNEATKDEVDGFLAAHFVSPEEPSKRNS